MPTAMSWVTVSTKIRWTPAVLRMMAMENVLMIFRMQRFHKTVLPTHSYSIGGAFSGRCMLFSDGLLGMATEQLWLICNIRRYLSHLCRVFLTACSQNSDQAQQRIRQEQQRYMLGHQNPQMMAGPMYQNQMMMRGMQNGMNMSQNEMARTAMSNSRKTYVELL
jgi:hypothetical protein